jgi:hypothetical protein
MLSSPRREPEETRMSDEQQRYREEVAKKPVVYQIPEMERVIVRRNIQYRTGENGPLVFDQYLPPDVEPGERRPVTLFVFGFPQPGFARGLKEMGGYSSWGRLVAASGLIGITYNYDDPASDILALLEHLRQNAAELGIDEKRIGLWSASGNVPLALSLLMQARREPFRCAALCYGFLLDDQGHTPHVANAAGQFGFVNAAAGKSIDDLPRDLPLFIARVGKDFPQLNETLDRFVAGALARNLPLTLINHASGPHGFDVFDDSEASRHVIRQLLAFLRAHLTG